MHIGPISCLQEWSEWSCNSKHDVLLQWWHAVPLQKCCKCRLKCGRRFEKLLPALRELPEQAQHQSGSRIGNQMPDAQQLSLTFNLAAPRSAACALCTSFGCCVSFGLANAPHAALQLGTIKMTLPCFASLGAVIARDLDDAKANTLLSGGAAYAWSRAASRWVLSLGSLWPQYFLQEPTKPKRNPTRQPATPSE